MGSVAQPRKPTLSVGPNDGAGDMGEVVCIALERVEVNDVAGSVLLVAADMKEALATLVVVKEASLTVEGVVDDDGGDVDDTGADVDGTEADIDGTEADIEDETEAAVDSGVDAEFVTDVATDAEVDVVDDIGNGPPTVTANTYGFVSTRVPDSFVSSAGVTSS